MTNAKKPTGLIRNKRIVPKNPEDLSEVKAKEQHVNKKGSNSSFENQKANLKVSLETKKELETLITLTQNRYIYEMVESMIDSYVRNELTPDQQRAFKTLSNLIN